MQSKLSRRDLLRASAVAGGPLLMGFAPGFWDSLLANHYQREDPFAGGKQTGTVEFVNEGRVPLDAAQDTELDGRLYTDLSLPGATDAVTLTERFYIRTRASDLLPGPSSWQIRVNGLAGKAVNLEVESLRKLAKPMGLHVMECAGNVRLTRFGLISAGDWAGVRLTDILKGMKPNSAGTRVLISGFDRYSRESKTSVPGASWVFSLEEIKTARAFLATELNGQPLTRDHGAPVRLCVPGWYGCCCIKWVNEIAFVREDAEATSQMQEYAARTLQKGVPQLAGDYMPAVMEQAAMPVRVEKWSVADRIAYRIVGIAWGGSVPVKTLQIRFNPEEEYVPVDHFSQTQNDPWTVWTHAWFPKEPGTYTIRLAVKEPVVQARKLDSGYYARTVEITEI